MFASLFLLDVRTIDIPAKNNLNKTNSCISRRAKPLVAFRLADHYLFGKQLFHVFEGFEL